MDDIVSNYTAIITSNVIAKLLGIPESDLVYLNKIVNEYLNLLSGNEEGSFYKQKNSNESKDLIDYFDKLIEAKSRNLQNDVISELIKSSDEDKLNRHELCSTLIFLLIAGYETTANLIPNSIFTFLTHYDQWMLLQQQPELLDSALEECLRYISPVFTATWRWAKQDFELHNEKILKGDQVLLVIGSANRDDRVFSNAEAFDITRDPNPHLSFGYGPHLCLGNFLGRMEFKIILKLFLSKVPNMRLAIEKEAIVWEPHLIMRKLKTLPVIF
jgi:cytochrome P450